MKKLIRTFAFGLFAVLAISAFVACGTKVDYSVSKKAFADLALEARTATADETVAGTVKTIPGSYKYKALTENVTISYDIPKATVENLDRYTRLVKVSGPSGATPYMLIADEFGTDTTNWTLWNVLGNISYPAFQYDELKGGSGSPATMKTFLAGKQTTHAGYWGNASAGNSYASNKQENGNLQAEFKFHFGADRIGKYMVTMEIVNLADGTVVHSVSKTISVG